MTPNAYKDALTQAKSELINAIKQRDHWTMEVARLQGLVDSLSTTVERSNTPPFSVQSMLAEIGLQDIVYTCVRDSSPNAVSPTDVRDRIRLGGLADLAKYSNPLAVIHGALKRLASQGRIVDVGDGSYRMSALYEALLKFAVKK